MTAPPIAQARAPVAGRETMMERVWTIMKNSGPIQTSAVASRTGISLRQAQQTIANLARRKMTERVGTRAFGGEATYRALGDTYDDARTFERTPVKTTSITPPHPRYTDTMLLHCLALLELILRAHEDGQP